MIQSFKIDFDRITHARCLLSYGPQQMPPSRCYSCPDASLQMPPSRCGNCTHENPLCHLPDLQCVRVHLLFQMLAPSVPNYCTQMVKDVQLNAALDT
jgi:hypothetical protein